MQRRFRTLIVLSGVFFNAPVLATFSFDPHIDFGHVPAGAEKVITTMLCSDDPEDTLLLKTPPEGFRFLKHPSTLSFSESRCHYLELAFSPESSGAEFTYYGNPPDDPDDNTALKGFDRHHQQVTLTTLSGTGLSPAQWKTLYPPDPDTFYYHTHMDFSKAEDFTGKPAPVIASATFSLSSEIIVSFKTGNLTKILMTDRRGSWEWNRSHNLRMLTGYCALALSPDKQWIAGGDALNHKVDMYHAWLFPTEKLNRLSPSSSSVQSTSDHRDKLYRVCNTAFSSSGTHLFTLGARGKLVKFDTEEVLSSMDSSMPTWLTAWKFDQLNGELEQPTSQTQVGLITQNNYAQALHGIAVTRTSAADFVVASHQHPIKHPLDRFYFDSDSGQLIPVNQLKPDIIAGKLAMTANGQFIAISPYLSGQPVEIHQCYSTGCNLIQRIDKYIQNDHRFAPSDVQFTHRSSLLGVTETDADRLTILKPRSDMQRWKLHQSLRKEDGLRTLVKPDQLEFDKDDQWLLVVSQSRILIFARLKSKKVTQKIHWRVTPQWWKDYLEALRANTKSSVIKL
ncbi:hypothetical protein NX722_06900 [Endozoicomonas gorgoniicola]|uniref:Uncharacterized protein n=1 Tax=Endozoicomonas gorgoniicola TaxID=1234144 RepID=A0ABT3MSN3_9GAMM|nr:hypothetical protein [Endozoicomonas gorgoniicola]MCW7552377.1 hypothetical protein [Endozoicomonas gorgoniicola]